MLQDILPPWGHSSLPTNIPRPIHCHKVCYFHHIELALGWHTLVDMKIQLADKNLPSSIQTCQFPCHRSCYFRHIEMALGWDKLVDMDSQVTGTNLPSSIHACQFLHHKPDYPHHIEKAVENSMPLDRSPPMGHSSLPSNKIRTIPCHMRGCSH